MKKLFTNLKVALTLLLLCGVCSAWAEDYAPVNTVLWGENFAHFGTNTPSTAGTGTGTTIYDNASITYAQSSTNTKGYNDALAGGTAPELLLSKSNQTWTISGIKAGGAKKISLTFLSNKTTFSLTCSSDAYTVSGSQKSWTLSLVDGKTAPVTFEITLENTGSSNARIDDVVLKVTEAGQSADATSINASDIKIASDATSGEIEFTVNNPVAEVATKAAVEYGCTWISDVAVVGNKVTFTATTNAGAERSATITITHGTVTKDVTVTQSKPTTFATLAALVATGEPTENGEKVTVTLKNEIIKSFFTARDETRQGIYLMVGEKEIEIYCKDVPESWVAGGTVSGTLENCTWKKFNSTWELCPGNWNELKYVAPTTYAINIDGAIANGTVEVSETKAAAGAEVTLTVTPAAHYEFVSLSVKDKDDNDITVTDGKFTMPASNVTVSATFAEKDKYTVYYYSLRESVGSEVVYEGEAIANAPTPTFTGWELVGWTTTDNYSTSTEAPELFDCATQIMGDTKLYAVFKKTEGQGGTFVLDYSNESELSSSTAWDYNNALDYTADDNSEWSVRAYKNKGMQLNKGKGAYIKVPECPNEISSIVLTSSAAQTVNFGSTDNNAATVIAYTTEMDGTIDLSGKNVKTGYLWSSTGVVVITKIEVKYGNVTTFYTTGNKDVTISDAGWATACLPFNATVEGATAYYVTVEGDNLTKKEANVIPAGAGVLLKGVEGEETTATFTLSTGTADTETNMMVGSLDGEKFEEDGYIYYILANDETSGLGFYWTVDGGASATCDAGKAVLAVPTAAANAKSFFLFDETVGIKEVNNAQKQEAQYNLNGVRVNGNYKGIVIINGKKVIK